MMASTLEDFESKEYRSYLNKNVSDHELDAGAEAEFDLANIALADIEISSDLMLAAHRC